MVFQDGGWYVDNNREFRVPIVFDNLIHKRRDASHDRHLHQSRRVSRQEER